MSAARWPSFLLFLKEASEFSTLQQLAWRKAVGKVDDQQRVRELLSALFVQYEQSFSPASESAIRTFIERSRAKNVPPSVVEELVAFYKVTNGVPCLDGFDFHACDDEIIFEWWDHRELWLAQRDFYTMRWAGDRYCLGDASNVSFSPEYEFATVADLIERALSELYPTEST